jgi:hypothetical protein
MGHMANTEARAFIDMSYFPLKQHIFLAHTQDIFGAGIIKLPYDSKFFVVNFKKPLYRFGGEPSDNFLIKSLSVFIERSSSGATERALQMLEDWATLHKKGLKFSNATQFIDTTNVRQPQFRREGKVMSVADQAGEIQARTRTHQVGFYVPIAPLIEKFRDQLV